MNDFSGVDIDEVRRYWDRRPCNIRHSLEPIGSREYFDEVEERKYLVEPHIPDFAEFHRWRGKRVLEVGCGIGTDTINFARHGAQVTAVDLSHESLEVARRRAEVFGLSDRIRFVAADAERLAEFVPPEPYDLIYSFGVIHHTPSPDTAMLAMRSYADPGTTVKLMVYHRHSWKVLWIVLSLGKGRFWRTAELVARHSEAQTGCPVTYTYTRHGVRQLVESAGFAVQKLHVEHIFPYRVPDYIEHRYVKEWYFRMVPAPLFGALEHRLGWHLCVTGHLPESRPE